MFQPDIPPQTRPTISVVIVARNAENHAGDALDSLVRQSLRPDQVVFYDDGSDDDTLAAARRFLTILPGLEVIDGKKQIGIAAARNRANQRATSDYIAVLDADDMLAPNALEVYSTCLSKDEGTDLLYADTVVFTDDPEKGRARHYPAFDSPSAAIRKTLSHPIIPFKHSSMIYRRRAIEDAGGYDESLPIKIDIELFLRFQAAGLKVRKLDHNTSFHRKHHRQVSAKRISGIWAYAKLVAAYELNPFCRAFFIACRIPSELLKMLVEYKISLFQRIRRVGGKFERPSRSEASVSRPALLASSRQGSEAGSAADPRTSASPAAVSRKLPVSNQISTRPAKQWTRDSV